MAIYTKTGDTGSTQVSGKRLSKDDILIETLGTIDELNSVIGVMRAHIEDSPYDFLLQIHDALYRFGAHFSGYQDDVQWVFPLIVDMEGYIDRYTEQLPPLNHFLIPGANKSSSFASLARTTCRRAERHLVSLSQKHPVDPIILSFFNRLSDYLFMIGRLLAQHE